MNNYRIINIILAGLISLIFIYSGLFSASAGRHPVPSSFEKITGVTSPSSGMSRAFSELVRGRLASAREYNMDSPLIFAFSLIQLAQRISILLLLIKAGLNQRKLLYTDIILSAVLFLYCFKGQIIKMAELITA